MSWEKTKDKLKFVAAVLFVWIILMFAFMIIVRLVVTPYMPKPPFKSSKVI